MKVNLIAVLAISSVFSLNAFAKDKYVLGTHFTKPASDIVIERIVEACAAVSLKCEVRELPGKRVTLEANSYDIDGDASRTATYKLNAPDTTNNLNQVKESVMEEDLVLVTKEALTMSDVTWAEASKLSGVGFIRGSPLMEKNLEASKQRPNQDIETMLRMIEGDKLEGAVLLRMGTELAMKKGNFKGIKIQAKPISKNVYYPWIHNNSKDIIPKIEEGLKKIKASGRYDEIEKKYTSTLK